MAAAICHQRSHRLQTVSDTSGRLISTPTVLMGACDDDCRYGLAVQESLNPELPIFNQLDEQESKQQRELQIITLMDRPYGGYSSSTLPCEWVQGQPPFNVFLISTGHSYSSIANYPFRYGDDPDRPIPPRHTQDENCPLQPCCHQRHCILRPTTLQASMVKTAAGVRCKPVGKWRCLYCQPKYGDKLRPKKCETPLCNPMTKP